MNLEGTYPFVAVRRLETRCERLTCMAPALYEVVLTLPGSLVATSRLCYLHAGQAITDHHAYAAEQGWWKDQATIVREAHEKLEGMAES